MAIEVKCPYCGKTREEEEYSFLKSLKGFLFKSDSLGFAGRGPQIDQGIGSVLWSDTLVMRTCLRCNKMYWYNRKTYEVSKE